MLGLLNLRRRRIVRRTVYTFIVGMLLLSISAAAYWYWNRPSPIGPTEIFDGIVYQCEKVEKPGIQGLVHLVRIDLTKPGMELYITPRDAEAVQAGWEYTTKWPPSVAATQQLSVTINGTLYSADRWPAIFPGAYAKSFETLISNHDVGTVHTYSYLLWFEDDLTPHLETKRPPAEDACRRARWGISGNLLVDHGNVTKFSNDEQDCRTAAGIDPLHKLLYLAVFDSAQQGEAGNYLVEHGIHEAVILDGGHSTCLIVGPGATGIRPRTLVYPSRAIADIFGVRALPLGKVGSESQTIEKNTSKAASIDFARNSLFRVNETHREAISKCSPKIN
jgi:hypothetical protein